MHILDPDALRLTAHETAALVKLYARQHGHHFISVLEERTCAKTFGWAAGLVLLMEHAKTGDSTDAIRGDETPEVVFHYLGKEVMKSISPELHIFLLKTAVLPTMTAMMAQALTQMTTASRILDQLYQSRYFTERRREAELVYQYHPLFREFLLDQARQTFSPQALKDLQLNAAKLLEESSQIEAAVGLLQSAGDDAGLVRIILTHAPTLMAQGRTLTLQGWLTKLPPYLLEQTPWALYWLGACTCLENHQLGQELLERAFEGFKACEDQAGMLSALCSIIESIMASWTNMSKLNIWVEKLRAFALKDCPVPVLEARITFALFMAEMWRQPKETTMLALTDRIETILKGYTEPNQRMLVGCYLVTYKSWLGQFDDAARIFALLHKAFPLDQLPPLAHIWLKAAETTCAFVSAEAERCLEEVEHGLQIAGHHGLESWMYILLANGTYGALLTNNLVLAPEYLDKLRLLPDHLGLCNHIAGWIAVLKGNLHDASKHAESALKSVAQQMGGCRFPEALNRFALAQLHLERRNWEEAVHHLSHVRHVSDEMGSFLLKYMYWLLHAALALDKGQEKEGLQYLQRAMALGRARGFVNFPWWIPSLMARLCAKALEAGIEIDYVRYLVKKRKLMPEPSVQHCSAWPWPIKVRTLGKFELTVNEEAVNFSRKVQQRPLDLLKAIIAFGGQEVSEALVTDALWQEAEGDAAHRAFAVTLHRLRKLIGPENLELKGGRLSLLRQTCYVDVWAFERWMEKADSAAQPGDPEVRLRFREEAVSLYGGEFLADDAAPWAASLRERLRKKFIRAVLQQGSEWEASGQYEKAAVWLEKGLEIDPSAEPLRTALDLAHSHSRESGAEAARRRVR